ncbi:MAG: alpha-galactosidase [Lachnospiraceae bacterium]|nr:alpha-galactosidase [Lachnospiraceae bacterium]
MIKRFKDKNSGEVFHISTKNTSYLFRVLPTGHLEHLYYGKKVNADADTVNCFMERRSFVSGNSVTVSEDRYTSKNNNDISTKNGAGEGKTEISLDDICLEYSTRGMGDFREPMIEYLPEGESSGYTADFIFDSARLIDGNEAGSLPCSYGADGYLLITLREPVDHTTLVLHYAVYESCDVITKRAVFWNSGKKTVMLNRLLSNQLDLDNSYYDKNICFTSFNGAWTREMAKHTTMLNGGTISNKSTTGSSSNFANPFVMVHPENTGEDAGEVYGFNLVYSGNHAEILQVTPYHKLRFLSGINPDFPLARLESGESFEAPEAVLCYSTDGFNGLSRGMHEFVRNHVIRGKWKAKDRPVLLNSWEAVYFKLTEARLLKLAKKAADCGIELFVMDDGWFGNRNDDRSSLGDWQVNKKKLPGGLEGLSAKIHGLGMKFGIWVEPEMVNTDSRLYKKHPDWVLQIPDREQAEGRNQRLLDLSKPEVREYLFDEMSRVFTEGSVDYVKWDYNRNYSDFPVFCDAGKPHGIAGLPARVSKPHACITGLYELMEKLTQKFPKILFEGCAAGGNRFDLGMLSYFPQIWASDDTDPVMRADIQNGYSYGYPQSCYTGHVSASPNHQTLRNTSLKTRFDVAAFTLMGYELNLADMSDAELGKVKEQVGLYKKYRHTLQFGQLHRIRHDNVTQWIIVSEDKKTAVALHLLELAHANDRSCKIVLKGLDPETKYHFYAREQSVDVRVFGDLINTMAPIHIRQGSVMHDVVAKYVKVKIVPENLYAYGDALMNAGVKLNSSYAATGLDENTRLALDFSSEMYFAEG